MKRPGHIVFDRDYGKHSAAVPAAEERTEVCGPVAVWQSSQRYRCYPGVHQRQQTQHIFPSSFHPKSSCFLIFSSLFLWQNRSLLLQSSTEQKNYHFAALISHRLTPTEYIGNLYQDETKAWQGKQTSAPRIISKLKFGKSCFDPTSKIRCFMGHCLTEWLFVYTVFQNCT